MRTRMRPGALALVVLGAVSIAAAPVSAGDRILRGEVRLEAPVADVWTAWTTEEGLETFFAPGAHVDLRVDGLYEIFFNPSAPPGQRGGDGMRLLVVEPHKRLAFTWSAPPDQVYARGQRTVVTLDFAEAGEGRTRLRLTHWGWGEGPEWDRAYDYFDRAWRAFVLPHLKHRFEEGPIDWEKRPEVAPVAATLKVELQPKP
jgi:uncharacterized protein YndB with AHSA1/START domain